MSIESSIGDAFEQLQRGRYDSAMTLACTSLDATASNEFGGAVGARWEAFVNANLDIITHVGFGGALRVSPGATVNIKRPESPTSTISNKDVIYKSIRNCLIHDASLPDKVSFTQDAFYGERDGAFHVPVLLIYALLLAVIATPSNAPRSLSSPIEVAVCGKRLEVNDLWGKPDALRRELGLGP